jgi:hypothetical protein
MAWHFGLARGLLLSFSGTVPLLFCEVILPQCFLNWIFPKCRIAVSLTWYFSPPQKERLFLEFSLSFFHLSCLLEHSDLNGCLNFKIDIENIHLLGANISLDLPKQSNFEKKNTSNVALLFPLHFHHFMIKILLIN